MTERFKLLAEDGQARLANFETLHGKVETPCFMPVATKGTAKHVDTHKLVELGTQAIIANAWILSMKPGVNVIQEAGGLHKFMDFHKTIFTDCGGFQMLREGIFIQTKPDGIVFKSPFTGKKQKLTPEDIMDIQAKIGSDVAMVLDYVPKYGSNKSEIEAGISQTNRWAEWSIKHSEDARQKGQQVFGIVHGGTYPKIRKEHAGYLSTLDLDGYALGGLSIGEPLGEMLPAVEAAVSSLPTEKPRYLMGVGSPIEMLESISKGIDVFDSVYPTQTGRHNAIMTRDGPIKISSVAYANDMGPLDEGCDCFACKNYSRSYVHHLSRMKEGVAMQLKSIHNLRFLQRLMEDSRNAIKDGMFDSFKTEFLKNFKKK